MIVSVCVDTVACAPRWRRLGFNDCKGSGFGVKHQTAKGKVASHAQPQTPEHPAPSMPSPSHTQPQAPEPQACPSIQPPPPLSKAKPSHPAKAIFGRIFAPAKNPPRTRQEPVKNPSRTLQAPAKPRTPTKKAPPGKPVIQASVRRFVIAM